MPSQSKHRVANALMLIGVMPLTLGVVWVSAAVAYGQRNRGNVGGSDVFLMMAVLAVSYLFAVLISGTGAVWSRSLAKNDPAMRAPVSKILRTCVCVILIVPLLFYGALVISE